MSGSVRRPQRGQGARSSRVVPCVSRRCRARGATPLPAAQLAGPRRGTRSRSGTSSPAVASPTPVRPDWRSVAWDPCGAARVTDGPSARKVPPSPKVGRLGARVKHALAARRNVPRWRLRGRRSPATGSRPALASLTARRHDGLPPAPCGWAASGTAGPRGGGDGAFHALDVRRDQGGGLPIVWQGLSPKGGPDVRDRGPAVAPRCGRLRPRHRAPGHVKQGGRMNVRSWSTGPAASSDVTFAASPSARVRPRPRTRRCGASLPWQPAERDGAAAGSWIEDWGCRCGGEWASPSAGSGAGPVARVPGGGSRGVGGQSTAWPSETHATVIPRRGAGCRCGGEWASASADLDVETGERPAAHAPSRRWRSARHATGPRWDVMR